MKISKESVKLVLGNILNISDIYIYIYIYIYICVCVCVDR